MNKAILTVKETVTGNNAGPKAKIDVESILVRNGFSKINFFINQQSKFQKLFIAKLKIKKFFYKNHFDEVILQYPTYSEIVTKSLFSSLKNTNTKLILFIHDVESLRLHSNEKNYIDREVTLFNQTSALIVHNDTMKKWLTNHGVTVPITALEIFDYLSSPNKVLTHSKYNGSICFAGNLAKANFLQEINLRKTEINVFGPNPKQWDNECIKYRGQYTPEELPLHLCYNFGLVWDGTSVNECNGVFGKYLKYNDPHKASLYISSGLPVIIWDKAALAPFIENNHIGLAVQSLNDIDSLLEDITSKQYQQMCDNVDAISKKLLNGYYTNKAVRKVETVLYGGGIWDEK